MNNNYSNLTSNDFYSMGNTMWVQKNKETQATQNLQNNLGFDISTVDNLICSDVLIIPTASSITVTGSNTVLNFDANSISSINVSGNSLVVNSIDRNPITLNFVSSFDCLTVENRIYSSINTNIDPGCIMS